MLEKVLAADVDKVETLKQIQSPTNTKELSRFLGMVTYVAKLIPNYLGLTNNLRNLIKENII